MDLTFVLGNEPTIIRIKSKENITFVKNQGGFVQETNIEGLKFNPATIVEEFPDLKGKPIPEIKREGLKRFKEHIRKMDTMEEIKEYITEDLEKHGYKLIMVHKKGFRPQHIKKDGNV